ncbi:hypothetical protein L5515_009157 [Caenorhabditis briggsae]|uniref:Uncharacterized protein n=1 Tax=Caenorhabditis briggsae TaxID=6238 RepID=A0AAE9JNK9_CAEBR|nr:hypothetical protein L5515_009157 [Caenorhabditis briggsae]
MANSAKTIKKNVPKKRLLRTAADVNVLPQAAEQDDIDSSSDSDVPVRKIAAGPSSDSSSSDSDSEFEGMTAQEILATIPKKKRIVTIPTSLSGCPLQHRIKVEPHYRRQLELSGIEFDKNFFSFTKEEDDKIRENWREFSRKRKITGHIFDFLGLDKNGMKQEIDVQSNLTVKVKIWPALCKGLENRYAKTVRQRVSYIFHPYFREEQDYDMLEVERRLDADETMAEISESMKIPPRFLDRKYAKRGPPKEKMLSQNQRIHMLKLLYESIIDNGDHKFLSRNFDWKLFRNKCREKSIDPPPNARTVNETFRRKFDRVEQKIFRHLEPAPTLKQKLMYVHEAYLRFHFKVTPHRRRGDTLVIQLDTLFTVVFEDYNLDKRWDPPPALLALVKEKKIDLDKIRSRLENVKEHEKRVSETPTPKGRFHVVVKRAIKLEELGTPERSRESTLDERLEISSIHEQSSRASSVAASVDPFADDHDDPLTEFEMSSTMNTTASFVANRNETILAGGGAGIEGSDALNDTSLGGSILNQSAASQKKAADETVQLDMSQDIWSQLVG